jgi:hypothetical protein
MGICKVSPMECTLVVGSFATLLLLLRTKNTSLHGFIYDLLLHLHRFVSKVSLKRQAIHLNSPTVAIWLKTGLNRYTLSL